MPATIENKYIRKPLPLLKAEYRIINVYCEPSPKCPIGAGSHTVFWVCCDGLRLVAYHPSGKLLEIPVSCVKVLDVVGAAQTLIVEGRVKYQMPGDLWRDLGPWAAYSIAQSDPEVSSTLRMLLRDEERRSSFVVESLRKVKQDEIDDFLQEGSDCF
jgi:hypothetical protein